MGKRTKLTSTEYRVLGAGAVLSLAFIARSSFTVHGELHFALFDDAMISMRFARNLAEGHGLVWNPGEVPRVEGYSNPLWTLLLAAIHLLPISAAKTSLVVMVIGAGIVALAGMMARAIALELMPQRPVVGTIALGTTVLYFPLLYWSLLGMEVGVLATLLGGLVLVGLRAGQRPSWASLIGLALLAAGCVVTRADMLPTVALTGAFIVWRCAPGGRWLAGSLIAAGVLLPLAAQHAFRWSYYGELLPNTYYLKLTGVSSSQRLTRGAIVFAKLLIHHLFPLVVFALPALICVDRFPPRVRRSANIGLLAALVLVQCAYSVYVGGDAWEHLGFVNRYIGVAVPELFVLSAIGLVHTIEDRKEAWWRISWSVVGGLSCMRGAYLLLTAYTHAASDVLLAAPWVRLSEGAVLVAIGVIVLVGHRRARRASERLLGNGLGDLASGRMALFLAFLVNFRPVGHWLIESPADELERLTRLGVHLRNTTDEQASIAVVRAGVIPYFSHRHSIDLLGKCDKIIARSVPVETSFRPGHNKYDLRHSIGVLRPDVIAEVRQHPRFRTEEVLRSYGYRQLSNGIYVNDAVPRRLDEELGRPWL